MKAKCESSADSWKEPHAPSWIEQRSFNHLNLRTHLVGVIELHIGDFMSRDFQWYYKEFPNSTRGMAYNAPQSLQET